MTSKDTKPKKGSTRAPKRERGVARTQSGAPGRRERAKPTLPVEVRYDEGLALGAGAFPETRFFNSANALLGYIEGRPGVKNILSVFPARGGEPRESTWSPERRQEVRDRLEQSEPAREQRANADSSAAWEAWMERAMLALELADDGGALAEVEVESDSGGET